MRTLSLSAALFALLLAPSTGATSPFGAVGSRAKLLAWQQPGGFSGGAAWMHAESIDPAVDPIDCPRTTPRLQLRASHGFDTGSLPLPCSRWRETPSGHRYVDLSGDRDGIRFVEYARGRISIRFGANAHPASEAPLSATDELDLVFDAGSQAHCARLGSVAPRRNRVAAFGETAPCSEAPNVVLIVGDDVDWRRLGFMGEDARVITPSLDTLASQGVVFENGHLSASTCLPTHTHLLSGIPPRSKIRPDWLPLAAQMRAAGLRTFQAGKLWLRSAQAWGFEENAGDRCAEPTGLNCGTGDFGRLDWDVSRCGVLGDPSQACPATQVWRDFLETVDHPSGERFFALFTPLLPHTPFTPPAEYRELYADVEAARIERLYLPMLTWFDGLVGEILADLEAAGMRRDTLVVYLADNGYRSEASIVQGYFPDRDRGKASLSEMGFRTPVIFAWPRAMRDVRGERLGGVVGIEDLFATLLHLVGRPVPADVQGFDLEPSWRDGRSSPRREHVARYVLGTGVDGWVVRTPEWRFTRDVALGQEHLYAIQLDPDEEVDLIDHAEPELIQPFRSAIWRWAVRNR